MRRDDRVDPPAGGPIADVGLFDIVLLHLLAQLRELGSGPVLRPAREDAEDHVARLRRAHHGVTGVGPREDEARIEGLAAKRVVARAIAAADDHGELRHGGVAHRVHQFRAAADDAALLGVLPNHEALHILKKDQRQPRLVAVEDKPRRLVRAVGIDHARHLQARRLRLHAHALVRHDAHRAAADPRIHAHEGFAVVGLVFLDRPGVDYAGQQVARIVVLASVDRDQVVNVRRRTRRCRGRDRHRSIGRQQADERLEPLEAGRIVLLLEIHRAADLRVHRGAAQRLAVDLLADGGLHQRRTGEIKSAALGHEDLVAEHRQVGPARHAVAHDRGVLRQTGGGDHRVVAKNPAEIVLVGTNLVLHRQEHARRVDQIDERQPALEGDALRTEHLLARHWDERARLHRRVVGDDHHRAARHAADAGDDTRGGKHAPLPVQAVRRPQPQFEKLRRLVHERRDALPRGQPAELVLAGEAVGPATLADLRLFAGKRVAEGRESVFSGRGGGVFRGGRFHGVLRSAGQPRPLDASS